MSDLISKVKTAVNEPKNIKDFLISSYLTSAELIKKRQPKTLFGIFTQGTLGRNFYIENLSRQKGEFIKTSIHGNFMYLDPSDEGISHELITYGSRERIANSVYRDQLSRLKLETSREITVLEIGANVGYYALQTADILGEKANIHAFEPSEKNARLLSKNVKLNGFEQVIRIHRTAVGDRNGVAELNISKSSNLHTIVQNDSRDVQEEGDYTQRVSVPVCTIDSFIKRNKIDPDSIGVIRMDLEGYEISVIDKMDTILSSAPPIILFIELHPHRVGVNRTNKLLEKLDSYGFSIISASEPIHRGPYERKITVSSVSDLYNRESSSRVILRK